MHMSFKLKPSENTPDYTETVKENESQQLDAIAETVVRARALIKGA